MTGPYGRIACADSLQQFLAEGACPFEPFAPAAPLDVDTNVHAGSLSFQVLLGEGGQPIRHLGFLGAGRTTARLDLLSEVPA